MRLLVLTITLTAFAKSASAFCGFYVSGSDDALYNNATQVVIMREGTRTVLSMQNNYKGPAEDFAMVVPVPMVLQKENVKTLDDKAFDRINKLAAPRLVEYWEQDPCRPRRKYETRRFRQPAAKRANKDKGIKGRSAQVTVEAQFKVGEYDIVILSATDSGALDTWLRTNKYKIPKGAEPHLRPYVQKGSKFFVAKVDAQKVKFKNGEATLSPLRFYYDSQDFSLPVRLGLINSAGTQDLIVHILAKRQRYEAANYKNVTIPTNINVKNEARKRFGEFYAALFDKTLAENPGAVVTEYSWDAGSCDPCPTPALRPQELATFGGDVLNVPMKAKVKPGTDVKPTGKKGDPLNMIVPKKRNRRGRRGPIRINSRGFVLTRLHARYSPDTMKDDIVFKKAKPIVGGREIHHNGKLEESARPSSVNNFQGRYAIRHEWTGPIECASPRRGIWGGPPQGKSKPGIAAADDTANAKRGALHLAAFVKQAVPEINLVPGAAPAKTAAPADKSGKSSAQAASNPANATNPPDKPKKAKESCNAGTYPMLVVSLLVCALMFRRRRQC